MNLCRETFSLLLSIPILSPLISCFGTKRICTGSTTTSKVCYLPCFLLGHQLELHRKRHSHGPFRSSVISDSFFMIIIWTDLSEGTKLCNGCFVNAQLNCTFHQHEETSDICRESNGPQAGWGCARVSWSSPCLQQIFCTNYILGEVSLSQCQDYRFMLLFVLQEHWRGCVKNG